MDESNGTMYFFLDEQNGWRLVVVDAAAGSRFYVMERTADGGDTWERINEDPFDNQAGVAEGVMFLDDNFGIAGLAGASQSDSTLYITKDGGRSFGEIKLPMSTEYSCAMKSHFRKSGNQMSGKWKSSYASLLAQCFV